MILDYINHTVIRSQVKFRWVATRLGLPSSTYYRWRSREACGELEDKQAQQPNLDAAFPQEIKAVIGYSLKHPGDGYRRLAYMMIDEDVVFLSPSSVYRILDSEDLLYRYKRSSRSAGRYDYKPKKPHDQWHTDILYLWVHSRWYFFVGVLDAWSRYLVHWDLLWHSHPYGRDRLCSGCDGGVAKCTEEISGSNASHCIRQWSAIQKQGFPPIIEGILIVGH